jgi:Cu+-exporting ATPase
MQSTTVVKDPVCGMDIELATAARQTEHDGQTYHFCSSMCKEKFDHNPAQYLEARLLRRQRVAMAAAAKQIEG